MDPSDLSGYLTLPLVAPRAIRSKFERNVADSERRMLRWRMDAVDRQSAGEQSEFVKQLLERMQWHHDQLEALIAAYDRRKTIAPEICGDSGMYDSLLEYPKKFIQARRERGFSLAELARRARISKKTLVRYERTNFARAPFETLCALAQVLTTWQ